MIVVKIELWSARTGTQEEIGRMVIANVGGDTRHADYAVGVCRKGNTATPNNIVPGGPKPMRIGVVKNYPREAYNVWRLIMRALRSSFPEEQ